MEAHGGYLIRIESFAGLALGRLAREALALEGVAAGLSGLRVSVNRWRKVVRLAYEGPHTQGRRGARWYGEHHALPRLLSRAANATVHAYVFDPDEGEEVSAYGNGHRVGGERLVYAQVELPGGPEELDEEAFEQLRSRWPLGHLAYVFGLTREALLALPKAASSALLALEAGDMEQQLEALLPGPQLPRAAWDAA